MDFSSWSGGVGPLSPGGVGGAGSELNLLGDNLLFLPDLDDKTLQASQQLEWMGLWPHRDVAARRAIWPSLPPNPDLAGLCF